MFMRLRERKLKEGIYMCRGCGVAGVDLQMKNDVCFRGETEKHINGSNVSAVRSFLPSFI